MEKISLTCPKCHNKFRTDKKIVPELSDPIDIDLLMYTCPVCHWHFFQNQKSKFQSVECIVDGIRFASQLEARRYQELKLLEMAGEISRLETQPEFVLQPKTKDPKTGQMIPRQLYIGDFLYIDNHTNEIICEDVKGFETQTFRLKWNLVRPRYPEIVFRKITKQDI